MKQGAALRGDRQFHLRRYHTPERGQWTWPTAGASNRRIVRILASHCEHSRFPFSHATGFVASGRAGSPTAHPSLQLVAVYSAEQCRGPADI